MTEEEMEKIAEMISNRIFAKIEADTIASTKNLLIAYQVMKNK